MQMVPGGTSAASSYNNNPSPYPQQQRTTRGGSPTGLLGSRLRGSPPRPVPGQYHAPPLDPLLTPPSSVSSISPTDSFPLTSRIPPVSIPWSTRVVNGFTVSMQLPLETPPTTPENAAPTSSWAAQDSRFLREVFPDPKAIQAALPYARSVSLAQDGVTWEGFVLSLPNQPKTLYVCGKGAERVQLRESITALLDLADEHLGCSAFVIALEKASPALKGLLHSFAYVNGQVVRKPPFPVNPRYVLVGIEI